MTIPILTTVDPGGGANSVQITFYESNAVPASPLQRVTIGQYPDSNPSFARSIQVTDKHLFIKRGAYQFAIPLSDLGSIGAAQVPGLSYSPLITLQPAALSIKAGGGNSANFTVAANSESAMTFGWNVNNGSGWVANVSNGGIYLLPAPETLRITPTGNSPSNYEVYCRVYNATGNMASDTVALTVT